MTHLEHLPEDAFRLIFDFSEACPSFRFFLDSFTATALDSQAFYEMRRRLLFLKLNETYSRKYDDDENFPDLSEELYEEISRNRVTGDDREITPNPLERKKLKKIINKSNL